LLKGKSAASRRTLSCAFVAGGVTGENFQPVRRLANRHPEFAEGKAQDLLFLPSEGKAQDLKQQVMRLRG
jgi:hypothetical protein